MTRVALIEPPERGGNWWGVIETAWAKQNGPPHPMLHIPYRVMEPAQFHAESVPLAEFHNISIEFTPIISNKGGGSPRTLWTAQVAGPDAAMSLLNIAYTCPDTHVHWAEAKHLRDRVEKALGAS